MSIATVCEDLVPWASDPGGWAFALSHCYEPRVVPPPSRETRYFPPTPLALAAIVLTVLALAVQAAAHVSLQPSEASQGDYTKLTFHVPNEDDVNGTTKIVVKFPKQIESARPAGTGLDSDGERQRNRVGAAYRPSRVPRVRHLGRAPSQGRPAHVRCRADLPGRPCRGMVGPDGGRGEGESPSVRAPDV